MADPRAAAPLRPPSPVRTWFDHHGYSLVASLGRVFERPWAALLTMAVMALSLALPLGLALVLGNLERLAGNVERSREITVFLRQDVEDARAVALAGELEANAAVAAVRHVTPAQGLESLRVDPSLAGVIDAVGDDNPLPHALVVAPAGDELALAGWLRELPEADLVQHDAQWRQRLDTWLRFGTRVAWVLAALFGLGVLLVVGNTVRLDIQSRRGEIGVLQLLGATDGFIRRPFLYLGAWYGLGAGGLAAALLAVAGAALAGPLAELAASYGSRFALTGIDLQWTLSVLAGATALGWLGAGLVTGHFLRQTRPSGT
ncbi:permease-like cell division protein FtsX [Luteimonas wenzhouensis]|jgi:cell division transport system permease protein|uniref:Cell division protein FtsX n=1 Tax=Luteimonas wenzhouensis TaxID=2599615 RepID=A0A5C5U0Z8_9GAMM|nr:permease-like cell division protein FtsX [Luteimonas wenzhouensis]NLW97908.1 FtsX-like permease family protein [Xanthomonadaceae bacterium]TWT19607.1 ABC transporter permease [Luteimonas wenzhouensis]